MMATPGEDWTDKESWALADAVPTFTVGSGDERATFWSALALNTPGLAARSGAECERRFREENSENVEAGAAPLVLEDWSRLEDGRYTGRVAGESSFVWLTVSLEGRLASDPRKDQPGYIEAVGGRIYELARAMPGTPTTVASDASPDSIKLGGISLPQQWLPASAVGVALVAGGLGFGVATLTAPPPPPPPPPSVSRVTKIIIRDVGGGGARTARVAEAQPKQQLAPAQLTLQEQRERAELRVERDQKNLENLKQKMQEDQQRVREYQRLEAERGGASDAVKMIFPTS